MKLVYVLASVLAVLVVDEVSAAVPVVLGAENAPLAGSGGGRRRREERVERREEKREEKREERREEKREKRAEKAEEKREKREDKRADRSRSQRDEIAASRKRIDDISRELNTAGLPPARRATLSRELRLENLRLKQLLGAQPAPGAPQL